MRTVGVAEAPALQVPASASGTTGTGKPRRLIELDVLRGFLLFWMALTHLPTRASMISNQTFGFVSGAEGFIFLSGFMIGMIEQRLQNKRNEWATVRDLGKRTIRVYLYHAGLLAIAFTLVAAIGVGLHRTALENLLGYYIAQPRQAVIAAVLLEYRPSLLDILPMYVVFMALTPLIRSIAQRWSWKPILLVSFSLWAAAQFGLRAWLYQRGDLFGLPVPQNATGSFDLYGWQLVWITGLALGTAVITHTVSLKFSRPVMILSGIVATAFLILRYSPVEQWFGPDIVNFLVDKWHLGLFRIIDFSAIAVLLIRFGRTIGSVAFLRPLASLGQASLEVFCVHVLCCLAAVSLSHDADPSLSALQQVVVLVGTISAMFVTAYICRKRIEAKATTS